MQRVKNDRHELTAFSLDEIAKIFGTYTDNGVFSLYRGVLVHWDDDFDTRILSFIDDMLINGEKSLFGVGEHEGCVDVIWNCGDSPDFTEYNQFINGEFVDTWTIENINIRDILYPNGDEEYYN